MPRKGDIVTYVQLELGDQRFEVLNIDGSRIAIKPLGQRRSKWVKASDFVVVGTNWKEKELWIILYKRPEHEDIRQVTSRTENEANQTARLMMDDPRNYTIISQHKITLAYKEPQNGRA